MILKPLADAIRDGDSIRAVIRGTGSNQDGKSAGITLPSAAAQEALIRSTYEKAGLDPIETTYVEAHGTGMSPHHNHLLMVRLQNVLHDCQLYFVCLGCERGIAKMAVL